MYIQLILGEKCNLWCKYCHLWKKAFQTKISMQVVDQMIYIISQNFDNNKEELIIEFQWWEPFLYFKEMKKIFTKIKNKFPLTKFIITTNWTELNKKDIIKFLLFNKNSISLNISYDGNSSNMKINRLVDEKLINTIKKNILFLSKFIHISIIGTYNKEWIENNYLEQDFVNNPNIDFFIRPEILMNTNETYWCDINMLVLKFKELDEYNTFYNKKNTLIEYNENLHKETICIDYDWTVFPNDYIKSYIKRNYKKFYLYDYKKIFNIFNYNHKDKLLNYYDLKSLLYVNTDFKKLKQELENILPKHIFNINKETKKMYNQI